MRLTHTLPKNGVGPGDEASLQARPTHIRKRAINDPFLRAVKDWVLCILNIKIEYFVCRFLGHVLILLLDVIYFH